MGLNKFDKDCFDDSKREDDALCEFDKEGNLIKIAKEEKNVACKVYDFSTLELAN